MEGWFDARTIDPWQQPVVVQAPYRPDFADDEELKKAYGIALAKHQDGFKAGLELFPTETAKALWASSNWQNDATVIANRDAYLKALKKAQKPLDKEELLEEILIASRVVKDPAPLLKLYSEVAGFTGKAAEINIPVTNNNQFMSIKFVSPDTKEHRAIDQAPNTQSKISNSVPALKLVSGSR